MLSRTTTAQIVTLCAFFAVLISTTVFAADPKVVKASHVEAALQEAQDNSDSKPAEMSYSPQWPEPPNTGAMLMRLGLGTIAVIGLCVASLWLGKPWLQGLQLKTGGTPNFYIEGTLTAGNRATLFLVRVGQTQLVAATDASGLKHLIAIPQTFKEVLDEQVPENETVAVPSQRFEVPMDQSASPNSVRSTTPPPSQRPFAGSAQFKSGVKD